MKNRVKELRTAAGMTQQQLADRVHVSSRTILSLEKELYNPSLLLLVSPFRNRGGIKFRQAVPVQNRHAILFWENMGYARHEEIFYQGKTSGFSSVTREKLAAESAARHLDMAVHKKGQK